MQIWWMFCSVVSVCSIGIGLMFRKCAAHCLAALGGEGTEELIVWKGSLKSKFDSQLSHEKKA